MQEADADSCCALEQPSLQELCMQSILASVTPGTVCAGLQAVSALEPAVDCLAAPLLAALAAHLAEVLSAHRLDFATLPQGMLQRLLSLPMLVRVTHTSPPLQRQQPCLPRRATWMTSPDQARVTSRAWLISHHVPQECQEDVLYRAVLAWALTAQGESRETALNDLLPLIRFPLMSVAELEVGQTAGTPWQRKSS